VTPWLGLLGLGGLGLTAGIPLLWLYLASLVDSAALGVVGATLTIVALTRALGSVNRRHQAARVAKGLEDTGNFPLEVTLVLSAFAALGGLAVLLVA
jgi:hypothetical protein